MAYYSTTRPVATGGFWSDLILGSGTGGITDAIEEAREAVEAQKETVVEERIDETEVPAAELERQRAEMLARQRAQMLARQRAQRPKSKGIPTWALLAAAGAAFYLWRRKR